MCWTRTVRVPLCSQEQARLFALRQNRSTPCKARHCGSQKTETAIAVFCFFVSHSRTERMIFHEVKGRCESVCTNVHTCRLRSRATQCRESSISARQRTCTNSIKADFCSLFCLFNFCVGLEPFEHRYARRTSSHFCLAAKPLYTVQSTAMHESAYLPVLTLR